MVYSGITACLGLNEEQKSSEALDALCVDCANKSTEDLRTILAPLIDKAERVDELERQVKNLEWQASEAAQNYRQELAAAEQRSRDLGKKDPDQC